MSDSHYITSPEHGQSEPTSGAADAGLLDNTYKIAVPSSKNGGNLASVADRYILQSYSRRLLPGDRCAMCCRSIVPGKGGVEIRKMKGSPAAYFGNVMRCERLWLCPLCAYRISENRRQELALALRENPQLYVVMATFTLSHFFGQPLSQSYGLLKRSYDRFMGGRGMAALRDTYEIRGFISADDLTYGRNGWHPHIHALIVLEWGAELSLMPEPERIKYLDRRVGYLHLDFWRRWQHIVTSLGGSVSADAFDISGQNDNVADYVLKHGRLPEIERPSSMKWGVADEITRMVVKLGRGESLSPWQLLARYGAGDEAAGKLFQEYAAVTKGKRQLHYSRGLRALLGMGAEKSVDELVTEDDAASDVLAFVNEHQWRVVLQNDARPRVIQLARAGDAAAVLNYLNGLPGMEYQPVGVDAWVSDVARDLGGVLSVLGGDGR